jgi:histone-lysine N-methyltransferase SETMAR
MAPLLSKMFPQGRPGRAPRPDSHLDNCRVHFSKISDNIVTENKIVLVPHPPSSPDLAPSDFWLFGYMKASLAGKSFNRSEELLDGINTFLEEIQGLN